VAAPLGIITTFHPDANRVGEGWTQTLATRDPAPFAIATDRDGNLFLAGQQDRTDGPDADVFVERLDSADPLGNHAPSVQILFPPAVLYATDPSGGSLAVTANAFDADGDSLTYTWTGPFIDLPVTTEQSLVARLAVGLQQTITVTVDDGRGGSASASFVVDVVGTPFAGTTAVPIDSACGTGFLCSYAPVTITAAAAPPIGSRVFLRTRVDQNPPIPVDLQAGSPPVYFDVSTNAPALVSPIDVCIDTRGMSFPTPAAIRMYQNAGAGQGWTDVTQSATGGQICGRTDTLGTFAIFYPQVPVTAIRTIAGNGTLSLNATDFVAGPATSTPLNYLFGGAFDRARNLLYISEAAGFIDRVDLNSETISRVAGNGIFFPGSLTDPNDLRDDVIDGGDPFATFVGSPYEMAVDGAGNVVFFDRQTCMIRRLDVAQNKVFNVAGTGTCGYSGDGGPASSASVSYGPMTFDAAGNLFLSDGSYARVRRIDAATGIITTVAGNGSFATPVNGAPALSTIGSPQGIAFDAQGQMILVAGDDLLRIAPGADNLIRGDADEAITILGGCHTNCVQPFGGDGLAASDPQLFLGYVPSLTVAADGAVILADRFRIRRIAPGADGVVTGASDEVIQTIGGYYDPAANSVTNFNGDTFATQSHLAFESVVFEDNQGRVIVVDGNNYRVRRFGFVGGGGPVEPAADLAVSITQPANGANVDLGAATNVDVLVSNLGPSTATPVRLRLPIPSGLAFVSGTIPDGVCDGSFGVLVCDMNQLGAGSSVHAALVFRPTATGQVTATFNVSTVTNDPVAANNSATVTLTVVPVPAIVDIVEQVIVTDAPAMLPAVTIGIVEGVAVTDQPAPLQSAMVGIVEHVAVGDAVQATGPGLPPVLSLPSAIVTEATGRLGTLVNFIASAVDDVDGPVPVTCTPASGSSFPIGVTVVTCSAADHAGNSSSGTFSVTVVDTTPPSIFVPSNITVDAATSAGATVSYFTFATDIVDGFTAAPCTPASGSVFPVGTTTVTCTATDTHGNSASRTFTVTVRPFIGTPQLSFRLAGVRRVGRVVTVTLAISNTGNGKATSITIRQLTARVLAGHGLVKEPKVPIAVGDLDAGTSKTVTLVLSPTAPRVVGFSLVEVGTYRNANSTASFTFSASQSINPIP
jgi:uncharacterized repeat protein (TIGR01451 family)